MQQEEKSANLKLEDSLPLLFNRCGREEIEKLYNFYLYSSSIVVEGDIQIGQAGASDSTDVQERSEPTLANSMSPVLFLSLSLFSCLPS